MQFQSRIGVSLPELKWLTVLVVNKDLAVQWTRRLDERQAAAREAASFFWSDAISYEARVEAFSLVGSVQDALAERRIELPPTPWQRSRWLATSQLRRIYVAWHDIGILETHIDAAESRVEVAVRRLQAVRVLRRVMRGRLPRRYWPTRTGRRVTLRERRDSWARESRGGHPRAELVSL